MYKTVCRFTTSVSRECRDITAVANELLVATPRRNAIKITFVDVAVSLQFASNERRFHPPTAGSTPRGTDQHFRYSTLLLRYIAAHLWAFSAGPLLYERRVHSAPIKARTLPPFFSRTYRMIIIYALSEAPVRRTHDSTPSAPFSPSPDSPLRVHNVLLSASLEEER